MKTQEKIRYKVVKQSGLSVQQGGGLELLDIVIHDANGRAKTLKLDAGQYVPDDIVQTSQFQQSLKNGTVYRAIRSGWIVVESPDQQLVNGQSPRSVESPSSLNDTPHKPLTEWTYAELVGAVQTPEIIAELQRRSLIEQATHDTMHVKVNDVSTVVMPKSSVETERMKNTSDAPKTYEAFKSLKTLARLHAIKKIQDKILLNEIISKETKPKSQIKIRAIQRLKELEQGQ
jgi:hypothetical protein